eukprot:14528649-Alexandrium_andersonii.AAC.1
MRPSSAAGGGSGAPPAWLPQRGQQAWVGRDQGQTTIAPVTPSVPQTSAEPSSASRTCSA